MFRQPIKQFFQAVREVLTGSTATLSDRSALTMNQSPPCPSCGAQATASILYGRPNFNDDLQQALADGAIILGGCTPQAQSPEFKCRHCQHTWRTQP